MRAASVTPERTRRACSRRSAFTVVLNRVRAMPQTCHVEPSRGRSSPSSLRGSHHGCRDTISSHSVSPRLGRSFAGWFMRPADLYGVLEVCRDPAVAGCRILCYSGGMAKIIAQRELRNENAKVMEAVTAGETFVVTRNGEPVAELRPLRAGRRAFISREEVSVLAAAGVRIDRDGFRSDLDHVIDQGL